MNEFNHTPVLSEEVIDLLNIKSDGIYVDVTIGGGGHSQKILSQLNDRGLLIGIDTDEDAVAWCMKKFKKNNNVILANANFKNLDIVLKKAGIEKVDGIIADFGLSSNQLEKPERGFSFLKNGPLDMRMNSQIDVNAADVVNNYSAVKLADIFFKYGEEKKSRQIAREIIRRRSLKKIETTFELVDIVKKFGSKKLKINPATRVFQALRIYVNKELENIEIFLEKSVPFLKKDGIIACISFHSLEDRIVKNFFKLKNSRCVCPPELIQCTCNHKRELEILTKKPICVSKEEKKINNRARSAKLRGAKKIEQ
ncbi:MAG: 16S rRNA (cytosine(1402)-N(4))-methyltransferase RsmH [Candidatus Muiribacteriota bacterium]